jgi:hypothetical protein
MADRESHSAKHGSVPRLFLRGWIAAIMSTEIHRGADVRPPFDRERMPATVGRHLRNVRIFGANILSLGDSIWSIPDEFSRTAACGRHQQDG